MWSGFLGAQCPEETVVSKGSASFSAGRTSVSGRWVIFFSKLYGELNESRLKWRAKSKG